MHNKTITKKHHYNNVGCESALKPQQVFCTSNT